MDSADKLIRDIQAAFKEAGAPATISVVITDEMTRGEQEMEITAALMREGMPTSLAERKAKKVLELFDKFQQETIPITQGGEA